MKSLNLVNSSLFILGTLLVISCYREQISNKPPKASAGPDVEIYWWPNISALLDGSGSIDPDDSPLTYYWKQLSGPSLVTFQNNVASKTRVSKLVPGVYFFELTVTDLDGLVSNDNLVLILSQYPSPTPACNESSRPQVTARLVLIGNLSNERVGMAIGSAGNKILFAGGHVQNGTAEEFGSSRVDIYDKIDKSWSTAELSKGRYGIGAIAAGNKIYFAGGQNGNGAFDQIFSTIDIYDAGTNSWSIDELSEPRGFIATASAGNKVIFAGGENDSKYKTSGRADILDLASGSWSNSALSEPRAYISAVSHNNKIYFAGGYKEDRGYKFPSSFIDIYDPSTDSWSVSELKQPMGFLAGTAVANKIYWTEGCTIEIKDLTTGISSNSNLSKPRTWSGNLTVKDNFIVFCTGGGTEQINMFDIYDTDRNLWFIGKLPINLSGFSVFSSDNVIYLAGGYINNKISSNVWTLEF